MHAISRKKLKEAAEHSSALAAPLDVWFRIAKSASWKNLAEVRRTFSSADAVGKWTVFNIKGNQFRLIAEINYTLGRVYIRHVLTHAEYDRGGWKK
jgi:mRNA interferase HigB